VPTLDRFKTAQASPDSGFHAALREIQEGAKRGHWIWYIFPQLRGLGASAPAETYGLAGPAEAADYVRDTVLRSRLLEIATAVADHLRAPDPPRLETLMGSGIDARKLVSSLTLFSHTARELYAADGFEDYGTLAAIADEVLDIAAAQGYPRCDYTLRHLGEEG
jgi:uncharacterized protein (DUF1810 family)